MFKDSIYEFMFIMTLNKFLNFSLRERFHNVYLFRQPELSSCTVTQKISWPPGVSGHGTRGQQEGPPSPSLHHPHKRATSSPLTISSLLFLSAQRIIGRVLVMGESLGFKVEEHPAIKQRHE